MAQPSVPRQDSIRLAGGDTTKVEYPAADPAMFESEEERAEISYAFGNDIGYNISTERHAHSAGLDRSRPCRTCATTTPR